MRARFVALASCSVPVVAMATSGCSSGPAALPDAGDGATVPADAAAPDSGSGRADSSIDGSMPYAADAAADASLDAKADAAFSVPVTLSDPSEAAFAPSVATRAGDALVAWHQFGDAGARVVYTRIQAGAPGPVVTVPDPYASAMRPSVATTQAGYVIAYSANDGTRDVVRAVELDATGTLVSGPDTLTAAGAGGSMARAAASGTEEAFAWTDGTAHYFAMRGPAETTPAGPVGTTLLSQGLLNFPRIALDASGTLFLAYRDGGSQPADWDVLLVVRAAHGAFGAPTDVSNSPGMLSDDIALAAEADGTVDIVWVDQDPSNVTAFEVNYAARAPSGTLSLPRLFGAQGTGTWTPCVVPGMIAAWNTGGGGTGPFFLGSRTLPPTPLLAPEQGNMTALGLEPTGALDFAYVDTSTPKRLRFSRRP